MKEVRGENFGAEKGAEKSLGKGRGCVFGSSPKRFEWPHPELVHWWLLVYSSRPLRHSRIMVMSNKIRLGARLFGFIPSE